MISWILNSIWFNLFDTGSFILDITFHNLKYLDKPIKCLEMRANIRSVRKINEFSFVFSLIFKNRTFFAHTSIFTKNAFLVISKFNIKMSYTYRNFAQDFMLIWSFLARELQKLKIAVLLKDPVKSWTSETFNKQQIFVKSNLPHIPLD